MSLHIPQDLMVFIWPPSIGNSVKAPLLSEVMNNAP